VTRGRRDVLGRSRHSSESKHGRVWIAWERQRRSVNLSRRVEAPLFIVETSRGRILRYLISTLKTLLILVASRRHIVFVQNPSMVLASLAALLKSWLGYWLIVDRHSSGFSLGRDPNSPFVRRILQTLSAYTIRKADLTVVTNRELAARVASEGGRPFVLPDPFPAPIAERRRRLSHVGLEILFICSWAEDEPILEVVEACRELQGRVTVFASGRPKKKYGSILRVAPTNFVCTGFLPDREYFELMARVDAVMAITRRPATLVCGGYEAISLGKPVILGDSTTLREYFSQGVVYTDCSPGDLVRKIDLIAQDLPKYIREVKALYASRAREWEDRLVALNARLDDMVGAAHTARSTPESSSSRSRASDSRSVTS
jgi:glycosyltransferase involved in cell wall biosynthesis